MSYNIEEFIYIKKQTLRKLAKLYIKNLSQKEKKKLDTIINNKLIKFLEERLPSKINESYIMMVYMPKSDEIDISPTIQWLQEKEAILYIPHISEQKDEIIPVLYKEPFKFAKYGIKEPLYIEEKKDNIFDVIIIPSISVNIRGFRLGRGKGYYDIFLKKALGKKVGVLYHHLFAYPFKEDSWDIKLDFLITEKETISFT